MSGDFSLDLSRLIKKAKGNTEIAVRKVMLETFSRVVMKSPVDTGRFRANWQSGIGKYSTETSEETDKNGAITIGKISTIIDGVKLDGRHVYLVNSLPYATQLEYGSSKQAPAGMVRTTLAEITARYGR